MNSNNRKKKPTGRYNSLLPSWPNSTKGLETQNKLCRKKRKRKKSKRNQRKRKKKERKRKRIKESPIKKTRSSRKRRLWT